MPDVKKKPRKISCLPCRTKKAKCDGQVPHCSRCIRNSRENQCIYPKPRTFGRPPKRAVFLKNQDLVITSSKLLNDTSTNQQATDTIQCREFIFENSITTCDQENQQLIKTSRPQNIIKYHDQILDIERIFSLYITRGFHLRRTLSDFELNPQVKMKSLLQHFTWLTTGMINLTIRRACQFVELVSFFDPEITITAFLKGEESTVFFFNSNHNSQSQPNSPLDSIPPEQAIQLIHYFFQLQPYSILINKTKLLHDYWNDSVEPLLLCVIYGIAIYTSHQTAKGNGFKLWDMRRNPFLNYAYILMEKFFTQRDASSSNGFLSSLGNYQAAVILGIFETMFGLSKHGMTIISLSYMMASDLGIFEYSDENRISNEPGPRLSSKIMPPLDPVDKEQLINTYWAALRGTAYGCVELGLYLRESILFHGQPFPPANGHTSASYQYDMAHNNHSSLSAYLIESFHTETVTTFFSSKLFSCLPKTEYNMFGCKTTPATPPSIQEMQYIQDHQMLLQLLTAASSTAGSYDSAVDCRVQMVLHDFSTFILQEKHRWSSQQRYTIETTYYLYCVHFSFIKSCNNVAPVRYHKLLSKIDLNDSRVAARIRNLQPTTWVLIGLLQQFLKENEEKELRHDEDPAYLEDGVVYSALLPLGIMAMSLETIIELTMLQYQLSEQPSKELMDQIKTVYELTKHQLFWVPRQQATTRLICRKLKEFLRQHSINLSTRKSAPDVVLQQRSNAPLSTSSYEATGNGFFLDENLTFAPDACTLMDMSFSQDFDAFFQDSFVGLC